MIYSEEELLEIKLLDLENEAKLLSKKRHWETREKQYLQGQQKYAQKLLQSLLLDTEITTEFLTCEIDNQSNNIEDFINRVRQINLKSNEIKKEMKKVRLQLRELGVSSINGVLIKQSVDEIRELKHRISSKQKETGIIKQLHGQNLSI